MILLQIYEEQFVSVSFTFLFNPELFRSICSHHRKINKTFTSVSFNHLLMKKKIIKIVVEKSLDLK